MRVVLVVVSRSFYFQQIIFPGTERQKKSFSVTLLLPVNLKLHYLCSLDPVVESLSIWSSMKRSYYNNEKYYCRSILTGGIWFQLNIHSAFTSPDSKHVS